MNDDERKLREENRVLRERLEQLLGGDTPWPPPGDIVAQEGLQRQALHACKMEAIGRLAGGVAHDFNNLLTVVVSYAEILQGGANLSPEESAAIAEILHASERAASLTRQLLTVSRNQVQRPATFAINEAVGGMADMLRRLIGDDIRLELQLDANAGVVRADRAQIEQVLLNLAINGRDAMPGGGRLMIATAATTDGVIITVRDTGQGMDSHTRQHLFEPFFSTKGPGEGSGMGLAIVYSVVQQSKGRIEVESEPGRGARFTIELPLVHEVPPPEPVRPAATAPARGTETIFLAEDDAGIRRLARTVLEAAGYSVITARDGQEALGIARAIDLEFELLLTDVVMPKLGGPELARELGKMMHGLKVVFMSGYPGKMLESQDFHEHLQTYLRKPFRPDELLAHVRRALDSGR